MELDQSLYTIGLYCENKQNIHKKFTFIYNS